MAINNWRYVVTWGYRNPDGTIVEEKQYIPNTTTTVVSVPVGTVPSSAKSATRVNQAFTPAEAYKLQADGYYNQGNTALWDAYSALWKWSNAYSNIAKDINNFYSQLWKDYADREGQLAEAKYNLANQLTNDLLSQRQYVTDMFWPNGQLTREVNTYYDDLWNYLATDAWRQAAEIAAQWMHSWASLWAIRAQQNEAYNQSFWRYVQAKEQEINAKQQIASNLINYMSALRQEYWDTTNQYIIQQYQRANDLLNSLSQSIASSNIQLAQARLAGSWNWNSSNYSYDIWWNLIDSNGKIVKRKSELDAEKAKTTTYWPRVDNPYFNATSGAWKATYWLNKITQPWAVG